MADSKTGTDSKLPVAASTTTSTKKPQKVWSTQDIDFDLAGFAPVRKEKKVWFQCDFTVPGKAWIGIQCRSRDELKLIQTHLATRGMYLSDIAWTKELAVLCGKTVITQNVIGDPHKLTPVHLIGDVLSQAGFVWGSDIQQSTI